MYGIVTYLSLTILALILAPISFAKVILFGNYRDVWKEEDDDKKPFALVTGGRSQKSLYITRALKRQGYKVLLAEEQGWSNFCAARFSNSIEKVFSLPSNGGEEYVKALVNLAEKYKISLFLPCSGVATAIEEARAAELMRIRLGVDGVRTIIQETEFLKTLHEKDQFIKLCHSLRIDAPIGHLITSVEQGIKLLQQNNQAGDSTTFLFKAATVPDDIGRADMTTYPLFNEKGKVDWNATKSRLEGLHIPICHQTPYLAQEFIANGSEWCTHATVIEGEITAFVCCPSNDMLMTYYNATHTSMGKRMLEWTKTFLKKVQEKHDWKVTGHFSFDFIYQSTTDRLVVIECNPRVHTAICLLRDHDQLGKALDGSITNTIYPNLAVESVSWIGHDLIVRREKAQAGFDLTRQGINEGAWCSDDPWPYFAFYHIQLTALMIRQIIKGKGFSRINISTARVFESK